MSFIQAGNNHPQENIYRPWFSQFIKKLVTRVWGNVEWIHNKKPLLSKTKACNRGFESLVPINQSSEFKSWILPWENLPIESTWAQTNKNLWPIHVKMVHEKDIGPILELEKLNKTSWKIIKPSIIIPYQTMYYNTEWKWYQTIPKWTQITYDNGSISSIFDKKTGKYQAYAKVQWFTKQSQTSENEFESIPAWYIRTPWFDGVINKSETIPKKSFETPKESISFSGYLWPDGREIPAYILKAVTVHYFGKKIVPKVVKSIQNTEQKIEAVRDIMKKEYITRKIPLQTTSVYSVQMQQIAEKWKLKAVHQSLQEFTINNGNIYNSTTQKILNSLQTTPEWELIKQDASYIYKKKRIKTL